MIMTWKENNTFKNTFKKTAWANCGENTELIKFVKTRYGRIWKPQKFDYSYVSKWQALKIIEQSTHLPAPAGASSFQVQPHKRFLRQFGSQRFIQLSSYIE